MADISQEINAIRSARYGEEVRGSIVDALNAVNDQVEDDTASAGTSATSAAASAAAAAQTATDLEDVLDEIQTVETNIETAESGRASAESSRVSAEAARVTAEAARADAASGYVNQAREYANQAAQHASSDNAILSRSWAVGGTGTRYGEDSNNAKYWSDVAAQVVTEGGVASFNGRTGNVEPTAGDYSSSDISRGSGTVENSLTSIETQLSNIGTSDTANNTVTFTSGDVADGDSSLNAWSTVLPLATSETHGTLFGKISTMFKNIRYLWKLLGNTSMGTTATTITGAIAEHESDISGLNSKIDTINLKSVTRVAAEVTTGPSGNIALPYENTGVIYILAPFTISNGLALRSWVSNQNNYWYLTAFNPNTGETANNSTIHIRYLVVELKTT